MPNHTWPELEATKSPQNATPSSDAQSPAAPPSGQERRNRDQISCSKATTPNPPAGKTNNVDLTGCDSDPAGSPSSAPDSIALLASLASETNRGSSASATAPMEDPSDIGNLIEDLKKLQKRFQKYRASFYRDLGDLVQMAVWLRDNEPLLRTLSHATRDEFQKVLGRLPKPRTGAEAVPQAISEPGSNQSLPSEHARRSSRQGSESPSQTMKPAHEANPNILILEIEVTTRDPYITNALQADRKIFIQLRGNSKREAGKLRLLGVVQGCIRNRR
jgi:hypothetical protein